MLDGKVLPLKVLVKLAAPESQSGAPAGGVGTHQSLVFWEWLAVWVFLMGHP